MNIHSPADGYLSCFQFLAITNKTAIYICICLCMDICFNLTWVNTKKWNGWIAWQVYVKIFGTRPNWFLMWSYHYSHCQGIRALVIPHTCQHLVLVSVLILILMGMYCYLIVVLICVFLITWCCVFSVYFLHVYHFWSSICLNLLLIF